MMQFGRWHRLKGLQLLGFIWLFAVPEALAQSPAPANQQAAVASTAEELFERATSLFEAGYVEEACPKFAESHRLKPDTRALLALATCHKEQHKYATAWAEFKAGETRARSEGEAPIEQYARDALLQLQPLVSTVLVEVGPTVAAIPELALSVDGSDLPRPTWNTKVPLDGGKHEILATAPHRTPWRHELTLAIGSDEAHVAVPVLDQQPPPAAPVASLPAPAAPIAPTAAEHDEPESGGWNSLQWAGMAMTGMGVVSFGTSVALALDARSSGDTAQGDVATVFGVTGGVLAAAGLTSFFVGQARHDPARAPQLAVAVGMGPRGGWALAVQGAL
jgi:hypothetical protein